MFFSVFLPVNPSYFLDNVKNSFEIQLSSSKCENLQLRFFVVNYSTSRLRSMQHPVCTSSIYANLRLRFGYLLGGLKLDNLRIRIYLFYCAWLGNNTIVVEITF